MEAFEAELEKILHQVPQWRRESREKERALKRVVTRGTVNHLVEQRLVALARQARAFKVTAEEPKRG
jgi:hypothetical protein